MPRRHIGDGPSPCLLGQILLTLTERAESTAPHSKISGATAMELAGLLGLSAAQMRTCAADLARARCVRVSRMPIERRNESGRYAQAFLLPERGAEYGPARAPRLYPAALIVEPVPVAAEKAGRALRELSMIPIAVPSSEEALALLKRLGFELVLVRVPLEDAAGSVGLERLREAARQAGCGPLLVMSANDNMLAAKLGVRALLASPTDPRELRSALADVLGGSSAAASSASPAPALD
jgi:ActR/RegA family two-component response regulator